MKNLARVLLALQLFYSLPAWGQNPAEPAQAKDKPTPEKKEKAPVEVIIKTNKGDIEVTLDSEKAPNTVENFLSYVDKGFYSDLVFHRVIPDFMIQGGGFDKDLKQRPTEAPIKNEAHNGLKNNKGTLAMARTPDPHSASAQFFINLKDNDFLNYKGPLPRDYGYAVFGKVSDDKSLEVVDAIGKVPTTGQGSMRDIPVEPVIIQSIERK